MGNMTDPVGEPRYKKHREGGEPGPLRSFTGLRDIRLRITLGDMPLEDAFEAGVPDVGMAGTLDDLLERLFGGDNNWWPSDEDLAENPDLPDLVEELEGIFRSADESRSDVKFFINQGPEAQLEDALGKLCRDILTPGEPSEAALLDLVIEQRFTPLAYSAGLGHWASRDELREHLEMNALLASAHGREKACRPESEGSRLRALADRLRASGLLDENCELTPEGAEALDMLEERRRNLRRDYDVFADIFLGEEAGVIEVGAGRGEDMRHHVYEAEGLDPVSTAFDVVGIDHVDEWIDDWTQSEDPGAFFDNLLAYTVETNPPSESALDDIIEAGLAYTEEVWEAEETADRARTAIRRSKLRPPEASGSGDPPARSRSRGSGPR